jgi:ElaB/YqjD/DUF883 family membrane-anchored ribosome-binding protein
MVQVGIKSALSAWRTCMVNVPNGSSRSTPAKEGQPAERSSDNHLAENSQENLDVRLDHAIEETFPTSGPVSVTVTKGPEPDRPDRDTRSSLADDPPGSQPEQSSAEHLPDQVRETLRDIADDAFGAAREAYRRGEHYARQAREQYPEAERYIREGQRAVIRGVTGNPLLALFVAGSIGYALAWIIHGRRRTQEAYVPDYGRTDRGYAAHREI